MFRPATAVLLGLALLAPATALTQSALAPAPVLNTVYRFETVDSFELQGFPEPNNGGIYRGYATVTGTLQGESTPISLRFGYSLAAWTSNDSVRTYERCERFALLAMNKPGQFLLDLRQEGSTVTPYIGCKLTRR